MMKPKHLNAFLDICRVISEQSSCCRRKFGAVIVNPGRNTILATGYNGGPRGQEGALCGSWFCTREGLTPQMLRITNVGDGLQYFDANGQHRGSSYVGDDGLPDRAAICAKQEQLLRKYPPIESGTRLELGCHHAEFNAIANAAADGTALAGSTLIVTGEPCLMCAKLIHHAGIAHVYCIRGGYLGGDSGPEYLTTHGVPVTYVEGPPDPRSKTATELPCICMGLPFMPFTRGTCQRHPER